MRFCNAQFAAHTACRSSWTICMANKYVCTFVDTPNYMHKYMQKTATTATTKANHPNDTNQKQPASKGRVATRTSNPRQASKQKHNKWTNKIQVRQPQASSRQTDLNKLKIHGHLQQDTLRIGLHPEKKMGGAVLGAMCSQEDAKHASGIKDEMGVLK